MNRLTDIPVRWLRRAYWSPIGAPLRSVYYRAPKPPTETAHWDGQVSGAFARRLGQTLSVDARNHLIANLLTHYVPHVRTVLDVGCAGGTLCRVLQSRGITQYTGVDISHHAIEVARQWNKNSEIAEFQQSAAGDFDAHGKQWDAIVYSEVLYYLDIRTVRALLDRHASMLADGGVFCVSLNLHPQGRAFQREIMPALRYMGGFLYQEKIRADARVRHDSARPLYHTFLATPIYCPPPTIKVPANKLDTVTEPVATPVYS